MMFLGLVELTHLYVGIGTRRDFRCCKWENISWETTGTKFPSSSPYLPKNSLPHTKHPATLLYLPTCVACVAKGRGWRKEKGRVKDHFNSSREGQKHSWARESVGKAQWDVVTALLVLVDLYRGQKQVEEREAEEVGCQPGVGWRSGWQCLCKQGAMANLTAWESLQDSRSGPGEAPSGMNTKAGSSQLFYHCSPRALLLQTSFTLDWKSHCALFTNKQIPFKFWTKISISLTFKWKQCFQHGGSPKHVVGCYWWAWEVGSGLDTVISRHFEVA